MGIGAPLRIGMTSLWAAEVQSFTRRALTGAPHTGHRRAALGTRVLQCGQLFADNIVGELPGRPFMYGRVQLRIIEIEK